MGCILSCGPLPPVIELEDKSISKRQSPKNVGTPTRISKLPEPINNKTSLISDVTELFENAKIDEDNEILKLYNSDYALFLSGTFTNNFICKKKALYDLFNTNNIAYLNHNEKNNIITMIKIYNHKITDNKYKIIEKIDDMMKQSIQLYIHKPIFFYNNTIDADVLYKKISFAKKEIFIPFDLYVIKKMEYKIKNFCQITEKLGVEKIKITYDSNFIDKKILKMNIKSCEIESGGEKSSNEEKSDELSITLNYPKKNQNYAINLNKYDLKKQIMEENTFLISNEEYMADIDLQYLLDSRCDNFITNYNTTFKISRINEFETSLFTKMNDYGLMIANYSNISQFIEIAISIKFINVYDNVSIIDGTNINPEKYGFINLCNFLKEETKKDDKQEVIHDLRPYMKIKNFLNIHIKAIQKKIINTSLKWEWDNRLKLVSLFNDIIHFNFDNDELTTLFYVAFNDNLNYVTFVNFRNIIIKGLDNYNSILSNKDLIITKYYFTSYQIHDIYYQQYLLVEKLKHITNKCFNEFTNNMYVKSKTVQIANKFIHKKMKDIDVIKELLEDAIIKSYSYKYGIAYCKDETPNLIHESNVYDNNNIFDDNISVQLNPDNIDNQQFIYDTDN